MYNNVLLSLAVSAIPILVLIFVGFLLLHKLYMKIRSRYPATVNCWFCNQNTCVPYLDTNSWTCPKCDQYNGFTKDGDYNREILQQLDCSNASAISYARMDKSSSGHLDTSASSALDTLKNNGFCYDCNEAQRLKVEKLAQFEPKNEAHFDEELKAYKAKLEEQYRLCNTCDRHLRKVLREKKKMVLGSKFLDFIIKGAELLKQPHLNYARQIKQQHWKRRLSRQITILTIINLICLCYMLPAIKREHLTPLFGTRFGEHLFIVISHILPIFRVLNTYMSQIGEYPIIGKLKLFGRTIFFMLMYSLGLRIPQIARINFSSLYVFAYPFALLSMSFGYKLIDGFKLTRFTLLLALWSAFAGGLIEAQLYCPQGVLLLIASAFTLVLTMTNEVEISPKLHDTSAKRFHKIYSEDYLSDDDTISFLSQQFNCSNASTIRSSSMRSNESSPVRNSRLYKSPTSSSTFSLNNMPMRAQFSPNSSFQSAYFDAQSNPRSGRSEYAASNMGDFTTTTIMPTRAPFFGSSLELNHGNQRSQSALFGKSGNRGGGGANVNAQASLLQTSLDGHSSRSRFSLKQPRNTPFTQYRPGSSMNGTAAPLRSPFSLSSNALYQQKRAISMTTANLLTPSRFSTTCLGTITNLNTVGAAAPFWLNNGDWNQINKVLPEPRQSLAYTVISENQSRASSQSSGFESQNERLNVSREHSLTAENVDGAQQQQQNKTIDNTPRAFQPIDPWSSLGYTPRPSVLSIPALPPTQLVTPLTVNCNSGAMTASPIAGGGGGPALTDLWTVSGFQHGSSISRSRDSFNLRKINDELPMADSKQKYKRGDLLRKWQESQIVAES